ncbi:ribonuclease H-like domain-containing protein [Natrarchaeobius oligotrophus]|uniref:DNA-binding protein n=1 Tax=Natrarchaeobius chitinivorans TaxID=1679083 RepID=A0A3N6M9D9_NATCH|nr:ribonuclease H-like domain-containing protein [Natrarchaeobius chitinivorans]RQG99027.1 DNA-binding protein [Natrarchaeobius chitinivorans]
MATGGGPSLLALRCDALPDGSDSVVRDVLGHFAPDLVYAIREGTDARIVSRLRRAFDGPVVSAAGPATARAETIDGVTVAFADSLSLLEDDVPEDADYVVCDALQIGRNRVSLDATLDGLEEIARYQDRSSADAETTFCSGSLPANYDHVWTARIDGRRVRLRVRGIGPIPRSGAVELATSTLGQNGSVATSSVPADRFGLAAVTGVGPKTADHLRASGYESRTDLAAASLAELRSVRGVGASTARTIRASARALAGSRVVRRTDEPVPPAGRSPLFVDVETDGLQPTVIWLIGTYDPDRETYVDFLDEMPARDDPGSATRAFVSWLAAEYDEPSLVAWNGHAFDFEHLGRFVARYAPEYREFWTDDVSKVDPYDWAVRRNNAVLPGRTNRLEDVAAALGCDRGGDIAAIDGKALASRLRRFLEHSSGREGTNASATAASARKSEPVPEIDWNRARRYCEADVRELAAIYEAIVDAEPVEPTQPDRSAEPDDESTRQSGLAEF